LEIVRLDGKRHPFALLVSLFLVRRGGAQCSIESQIINLTPRRARLNVAAAFAFRVGMRTTTSFAASEFVERSIQAARGERLSHLDLFSPLPPTSIAGIENVLPGRINQSMVVRLFGLCVLAYPFFFS
jgi:hypothetical protein